MPVVGFLRSTSADGAQHLVAEFRQALEDAGYVEGRNVAIEYRWADGHAERLPELAADLVRRQVRVIVVNGVAVKVAMAATATIPIVFVVGIDPVRSGLVTSLNRPGGNVTGTSIVSGDLIAKRLEVLLELIPRAAMIAALVDRSVAEPDVEPQAVRDAARMLGRDAIVVTVGDEGEFEPAFAAVKRSGAHALLVGGGAFFVTQRRHIVALAASNAIPASFMTRDSVEAGGLISYGPNQRDAYRRAGGYVGRILAGTKPADLPVQLPTKYEVVINVKTAKVLGLDVPLHLQQLADEVIE